MNKRSRKAARRPAAKAPPPPRPRISDRVAEPFPFSPNDPPPARHDGWNAERKRVFLESLAACGVVEDAARAAGMSKQSAYALRNRACGRAFQLAWNAALILARARLADDLMSRAVNGTVEVIVRDGKVWGERHRFDNRLTMDVLNRLDAQALASHQESRNARNIAEEFDEFVDIVARGAEAEAAAFVATRQATEHDYRRCREARLLDRLDRYRRDGAGLDPVSLQADDEDSEADEEETEGDDENGSPWGPSTSSTSDPDDREIDDEWPPSTSSTSVPDEAPITAEEADRMAFPLPEPPRCHPASVAPDWPAPPPATIHADPWENNPRWRGPNARAGGWMA